ncbi:MAG: carbonic anhydrase [Alphaproteobacteria bacterium]|nr:carbonic anhydrase [Alphaproteobacteria bacterium]
MPDGLRGLIAGVRRFQAQIQPSHRELFEHLAHGQTPEVLFVCCSDSRVDPSLLTQSPPGKLFVLRNAGNLVPDYSNGGGEAATIAYAIEQLEVHHVVVCGHSGCGAVTAVLEGADDASEVLQSWLAHAGDLDGTIRAHWPELRGPERLHAAVHLNAHAQLDALRTHPSVAKAEAEGRLELHAWVYDIGTGHVTAFDSRAHAWLPLADAHGEDPLVHELEGPAPEPHDGWLDHGPWSATLVSVGPDRAAVRAALVQITGSEQDVDRLLARVPAAVLEGLTRTEAEVVQAWVADAGGTVEIRG